MVAWDRGGATDDPLASLVHDQLPLDGGARVQARSIAVQGPHHDTMDRRSAAATRLATVQAVYETGEEMKHGPELVNAELAAIERPSEPTIATKHPGYWLGSSAGEIRRLRADNLMLRRELARVMAVLEAAKQPRDASWHLEPEETKL
jgi:hypothetical protein